MTVYADSDFFLAIVKEEDWLKSAAKRSLEAHRGNIVTGLATVLEVALVAKRERINIADALASLFQVCEVEGITLSKALEAALLIEEGFGVLDSFHAALSGDLPILSSDGAYEKMGKECVRMER